MRTIKPLLVLGLFVLSLAAVCHGQQGQGKVVDNNGKPLTETEQKAFLATRLPSGHLSGTFDTFANFLFALNDVALHTENSAVAETKLISPFPNDYLPTWSEYFDTLAVQTKSTWKYDAKRNYWVFSSPRLVKPFEITMAEGWRVEEHGMYTGYKPPTYPVGMDIYELGTYSATVQSDESKLFDKVRDTLALRFAVLFDRGAAVKNMTTESVGGATALFFEAVSPARKELMWRQWVFVKNGKAFAIVSSLKNDDLKLFEDVKAMVKSFRVK